MRLLSCLPIRPRRSICGVARFLNQVPITSSTIYRSSGPGFPCLGHPQASGLKPLLDMDQNSVLILFDIRRYENEIERLALLAASQGVTIILFTDQWGSPIERIAHHCFRAMVEAPSSWDSTIAINLLIETMIARIQILRPEESSERIKEMEKMIGVSEIFRKP